MFAKEQGPIQRLQQLRPPDQLLCPPVPWCLGSRSAADSAIAKSVIAATNPAVTVAIAIKEEVIAARVAALAEVKLAITTEPAIAKCFDATAVAVTTVIDLGFELRTDATWRSFEFAETVHWLLGIDSAALSFCLTAE